MPLSILSILTVVLAVVLGGAAISANAIMTTVISFGFLLGVALVVSFHILPDSTFRINENKNVTVLIVSGTVFATIIGGISVMHVLTVGA